MSKMTKIPLAQASATQLREFAQVNYGLEIAESQKNKNRILERLSTVGFDGDYIELPEAHAPVSAPRAKTDQADADGREMVTILIPNEEKPGGEEPVPVAVNGKLMYIPRGEPVPIPRPYLEVLQNAVQDIYSEFDGDDLGGLKTPRRVHSYPFSVHA